MGALLSPGDRVVAMTPCYQSLTEIARSRGCDVVAWEPHLPAGGAPRFPIETLEEALSARPTRLVVCNLPHNPTGALLSHTEFEALVSLCRRHGCYLFVDEMYRGLEHGGSQAQLPAAVDAYPERGISLGGLSKSYGLPGLRIGW